MYAERLRCTKCGREYDLKRLFTCDCGGVLTVEYDFGSLMKDVEKRGFGKGPTLISRYHWLLPVSNPKKAQSLGEGGTPLLKCRRLSERMGLKELYIKDDSRNPSGSFKDRAISVGTSIAVEEKVNTVITASTGNAATALSAYSARAGLRCIVLIPATASAAKLAQAATYGAQIVPVKGTVGDALNLLRSAYERWGWPPMPTSAAYNPRQTEGAKTCAYEICEQLDWKAPDCVVVSVGGGDNLFALWKGFNDLRRLGFTRGLPRMIGVQASGCAPIVEAYKKNLSRINAVSDPQTVASGIRVGYPPTGYPALQAIKESKGGAVSVDDERTLKYQRILAQSEGVFGEPSGTIAVAALEQLKEDELINPDDIIVCDNTGYGLKEFEALTKLWEMPEAVEPTIEAVARRLGKAV